MNSNLDVGSVISRVFAIYGEQFGVLFLAALAVNVVTGVVALLFTLASPWLGLLFGALLSLVAAVFYTGMVVRLVEDVQGGRPNVSVGQLFESVAPVVAPLIGAAILAGIGITIGFFLLFVPGVILLTIWAVVAPVIVIERSGVIDSFGRSLQLVKPNFWQTLGVIVVMTLILFVIALVLGAIGVAIGDDVGGAIFRIVAGALTAPLVALAAAVIYFELRGVGGGAVVGAVAAPSTPPPPPPPPAPERPAPPPPPESPPSQGPSGAA